MGRRQTLCKCNTSSSRAAAVVAAITLVAAARVDY
jgi:hypothetical protein